MLIAHYRLDGDATDSVGNRHGILEGDVSWVDGKVGGAARTAYGGPYIRVPHDPEVSAKLFGRVGRVSLTAWVNIDSFRNYGLIVGKNSGISFSNSTNAIWVTSSDVRFVVGSNEGGNPSGSVSYAYAGNALTTGTWHHVAAVLDGDWMGIYVDGVLQDSGPSTLGRERSENTADIIIGGPRQVGRAEGIDGEIQHVRIYDHALSPREVRDLSLGLFSRYNYDGEDLHDYTGRTTTLQPSTLPIVEGISPTGQPAISFDGTTQFLDTGDSFPSMRGDIAYTLSAWVLINKSHGSAAGGGSIIGHASAPGFGMQVRGQKINFGYRSTSNFTGTTTMEIGRWYHVACVREVGGACKIYLNGELDASDSGLNVRDTTAPVQIGVSQSRMGFFDGKLSDVCVYTTSLTAVQVKELYQQKSSIDSGGSVHTPSIQQNPRARYIRDWTNGSTSNRGDHWLEVRAIYAGENISLGKPVTASASATRLSKVTDGTTGNGGYAYLRTSAPAWVQVDLEEVREIDEVQVWHFNADRRTYHDTKTEISEDGINWTTIFDSAVSGTYQETPSGVTHQANALGPFGVTSRGLRVPDASEVGVTRGLVAWYPLIGDAKDYAGTNHATNNGAVATAEGYEFDGSASLSANTAIPTTGTQEWTVAALVRLDRNSVGTQYLLNFNRGVRLTHTSTINRTLLHLNIGVNDSYAYGGTLPLGEWVHLTAVVNETTRDARLYLNGQVYGTSGNWDPTDVPSGIPSTTTIGGGTYGAFRDLRIHNVALTPEEVALQAKLALGETNLSITSDCLYTRGQLKEVIA